MPYTMEDFVYATSTTLATTTTTTTIQARRLRPQKLTIKIPDGLRLPIASPSPLFDGMNEDINTEPFPEFIDPCPPVKAEPLHCILHCNDGVCKRLVETGRIEPPCRCGDEIDQKSPCVTTPLAEASTISMDGGIFEAIADAESDVEPGQTIEIRRDDIFELIEQLKEIIIHRTVQDKDLMLLVRSHAPLKPEDFTRDIIVKYLFELIKLYFNRTMHDVNSRKITPQQLRAELQVYLWTGLCEWIARFSDPWEREKIKCYYPKICKVLGTADFFLAGAVAELWLECLEDVVKLLVWRDLQARKQKANQRIGFFGFAGLGVYVVAAGISRVLGYW